MQHLIFSTALALSLSVAGCDVSLGGRCDDCGECGIAGPVQDPGKEISLVEPGVTKDGIAAVDIALEDGVCVASNRKTFRLSFVAGAVTVDAAEDVAPLDATKVTVDGATSTWTDRDLTMSSTVSGTTQLLAFTSAGKIVKVACSGANHAITCAPM